MSDERPSDPRHPETTRQLLLQAGRLRKLAESLLGDGDAALDAAHDAWLAGSEGAATAAQPGYLRAALTNRLRDLRRSRERRQRHERVPHRAAAAPATVEVAAQAEIPHRLLDAVAALDEPLRTAVWLRFFEDQPPRAIAKRTGAPVNTVRSRIRLGIEALRKRLDADHGGDRRRWQNALALATGLPALGRPATLTAAAAAGAAPWIGALTMKKIALAAATALAFMFATWLPTWFDPSQSPVPDPVDLRAADLGGATEDGASRTEADPSRANAVAAATTAFTVQGTIELRRGADGALVEPGDGIATLQDATTYELHEVEVRDGGFSLRLDGPTELRLESVRLDDWNTEGVNSTSPTRCSIEQPRLAVVLHANPTSLLHVVDAESSTPLRQVDVVRSTWDDSAIPSAGDPGFPGKRHDTWVQGAASPFVVPSHDVTSGDYFVSAPGYAWQAVSLQHQSGGERLVMLHPGGDLEVFVEHAPADLPPAFLRVRDATGRCIRERTWTQGTVDIGGLPVGELTLGLEYGARQAPEGRRLAIATGTATITASGRARAVLDCAASGVTPPALDQRRDLEGTLTADPKWRTGYVPIYGRILALPLDRPALEGEIESTASGRWDQWKLGAPHAWRCKGLLPGRYRLVAVGFGMTHEVEVPATGEMPVVDLVVPDPITCEVVATGVDDQYARNVGSPLLLTELDGQRWSVAQGKAGDPARVRCVPGDYRLKAGLGELDQSISLRTDTRIELPREPRVGMHVEFYDATAPVPVDPALVRLTHPDDRARVLFCADVGFMLSIHVNKTGTWRLQLDLPGYRPVDRELDFRVTSHQQRISIPLERR